MERIECVVNGESGFFGIPLDCLRFQFVDGRECVVFDELTALELASHLEEGAHAFMNPGKPMPKKREPSEAICAGLRQELDALRAQVRELDIRTQGMMRVGRGMHG